MAFRKTAGCLILAAALASAMEFPVRHEHLRKGCEGTLTIDETGVSFTGAKDHQWKWKFEDIQQFTLEPHAVRILTYQDRKLLLGADRAYEFTGDIPAEALYPMLSRQMDQRLVAGIAHSAIAARDALPAKHLTRFGGSQGTITFASGTVVYETEAKNASRTWRYSDIRAISSSGPFELTVTTFEKDFNFQLKQPLGEARYNQLWLAIEKQNRRIQ